MSERRAHKPVKLERRKLDGGGVTDHFSELTSRVEAVEIRIKDAATGYSEASSDVLAQTVKRLVDGQLSAIQVRFYDGGHWWCDTVLAVRDSFRLVRMRQGDDGGRV